jgi:hypothetical protein
MGIPGVILRWARFMLDMAARFAYINADLTCAGHKLKTKKHLFYLMAALSLFWGCAERQDANLPANSNVLAFLGSTPVRGVAFDVAFANNLAYVADSPFGISIYDITNPSAPQLVDSVELFDPDVELITIDPTGRIAALQGTSSLNFYDLQSGEFLFDAGSSGHVEVELVWGGDTLTVYRSDRFSLNGFNVEAYENTGGGDTLQFGFPYFTTKYSANLTYGFARYNADWAFVCLDLLGVALLDHSVPTTSPVLAQINTPGRTRDAALSGDVLCLASGYDGLVTVDVSDPENPVMLGFLSIANATNIEFVEVAQDRAYLLDTNDGVFAVDLSDPQSPILIGELLTSNPSNFCLAGDLILMADEDMGLVVVQILF